MQTWERLYGDREKKDRMLINLSALKERQADWEADAQGRKTHDLVRRAREPNVDILIQAKARREQRAALSMYKIPPGNRPFQIDRRRILNSTLIYFPNLK